MILDQKDLKLVAYRRFKNEPAAWGRSRKWWVLRSLMVSLGIFLAFCMFSVIIAAYTSDPHNISSSILMLGMVPVFMATSLNWYWDKKFPAYVALVIDQIESEGLVMEFPDGE